MNILLFTPQERIAGTTEIRVCGRRSAHLRSVYGAAPGKRLRAGEIGGDIGEATLLSLDGDGVTLSFNALKASPPKRPLTVVLALPRPKMLRRMLRTVAESGVREVHLINAQRVEKSFWQSNLLTAEAIEGYLLSGLEQSMDTVLPAISLHRRFRPFAEDRLPGLATGRRALLAHPGASVPCPADGDADTLLMIGPEGGFIDFETALAQRAGLQPVSLGDRILRAETALAAMLGRFLVGNYSC
ncbi:MAG: 16S rRNA (uracil(1498)-N(3))-methyltransferase [Chromatocurvus sp.]